MVIKIIDCGKEKKLQYCPRKIYVFSDSFTRIDPVGETIDIFPH